MDNNLEGESALLGLIVAIAIKSGIKPDELAEFSLNKKAVGEYMIELMGAYLRTKLPKENK